MSSRMIVEMVSKHLTECVELLEDMGLDPLAIRQGVREVADKLEREARPKGTRPKLSIVVPQND